MTRPDLLTVTPDPTGAEPLLRRVLVLLPAVLVLSALLPLPGRASGAEVLLTLAVGGVGVLVWRWTPWPSVGRLVAGLVVAVLVAETGTVNSPYALLFTGLILLSAFTATRGRFLVETVYFLGLAVLPAFFAPVSVVRFLNFVALAAPLLLAGGLLLNSLVHRLRQAVEQAAVHARALQEREQRYRSLFDRHPDATYSLDLDGRVTSCNRALEAALGMPESQIVGMAFSDYLSDLDAHESHRRLAMVARGESTRFETTVRLPGGRVVVADVTGSPIIVDGRIVGVYGVAKDITDQRRVERELRLHAARQAAVLALGVRAMEARDVDSFLAETVQMIAAVIDAADCTVGMPDEDTVETPEVVCVPIRGRDRLLRVLRVTPGGSEGLSDDELRFLQSVATVVAATLERQRLDVLRRLGEERSRLVLERHRLALAAGRMGVWELDLSNGKVLWSDAPDRADSPPGMAAFAGVTHRAQWEALVHPVDRALLQRRLREAIEQTGELDLEYRLRLPDGTVQWVCDVATVQRDHAGRPLRLLGVVRDVTDRRGAQEELHLREEQLRQAQKMEALGQLAGGIAHDFNNILTAILGYADLLQLGGPAPIPEVEGIRSAAHRARDLIDQLLTFSRRKPGQTEAVDVNDSVRSFAGLLERLLGERVAVSMELAAGRCVVELDPVRLEQIILNLVVNARDAMPDGGSLTMRTEAVELDARAAAAVGCAPGRYVRLTVADDGCGMPTEVVRHAFEPFYTTKAEGQGTGMGLATVYGIVTHAGGYIGVDSEVGSGTRVTVDLPLSARWTPNAEPAAAAPAPASGTGRILLVEDQPQIRTLLTQTLQTLGYDVLTASDGREALSVADGAGGIDLLLTDVIMPELNGTELAQRLREQRADLRVIFMSGYTRDQVVPGRDGPDAEVAFLQKPFGIDVLAGTIRRLMSTPIPSP